MNIDIVAKGKANFKVFATSKQEVKVTLRNDDGTVYYNKVVNIDPETVLDETVEVGESRIENLTFEIESLDGKHLMTWHTDPDEIRPIPDPAEAALLPEQIKTNDQLYLTGLHLEQYRHATYSPVDYYEEALRRDPMDYRCNNALGLWYIRKCRFDKAEQYLRRAVKVLMKRNPNPYDGEPIYNLGLALKYQYKMDEAYDMFYKSTWNGAWQDAGFFECAQISVMQHRLDDAKEEIESCLIRNTHNHKARALKAMILRLTGNKDEAVAWCEESLKIDLFNYGCLFELYLLTEDAQYLNQLKEMMHGMSNNYDELALDYQAAGLYAEALKVLGVAMEEKAVTPMTYYYMGWMLQGMDETKQATEAFAQAEKYPSHYCFPNRPEAALALQTALESNENDAKASYYLGCLYYDKRQYDVAVRYWNRSADADPKFPTVWRNLALALFNKEHNEDQAIEYMEKAFSLDTTDARILMELDQLYKRMGHPHATRLQLLQKYPGLIAKRDDLLLEEITLLNQTGQYEEAMKKLDAHQFHPWEGGEGKVSGQYQLSRLELAKKALASAKEEVAQKDALIDKAISLLEQCLVYPHHLGEGKLYGAQENDFYYFLGCAYDAKDDAEKAKECWEEATKGPQEPAAAMYYNDAKPDKIFYQGLALLKLGRVGEAHGRFYKLVNYGKNHLFEDVVMDYFAVSLPDLQIWEGDLNLSNQIHCKYMLALGFYGLGDKRHAERYLTEASELDKNHLGILSFQTLMDLGL